MADWTLLALDTPLAGNAQRAELTMASSRSMTFSLDGTSTLSFSLPGRHWQTELLEPLTTDILVYRDDYCVQRYRLTAANFSKSGEQLSASFSAVSYRDLLNVVMFHAADTRRFINVEQTAIAWTIINEAQVKTKGDWDMTRGTLPGTTVLRTLDGDWEAATPNPYYYEAGKRRGDAIADLGNFDNGFEWDIEPNRGSETLNRTSLKFNTWNVGARKQYTPRCPFTLDDGGNITAWQRNSTPSDFANVIHMTGRYPPGVGDADEPLPAYWEPSSENPGGAAPEGRWEREVSSDAQSVAGIQAAAVAELDRRLAYQPVWSVTVAPGKWFGPTEMWIGDYTRLIINDGPIQVDADVRVHEINIGVDDNGLESLALTLDRKAISYGEYRADLERRIQNLERR